jgi:penicillin-binding protein 1A
VTILIWERMLKQMGYSRIIERIGLFLGEKGTSPRLEKRIPNEMATALGTGTASPLAMAQAYSVFANGGKGVTPISILKVYDRNGKLLDDFQTSHAALPQKQIIEESTAKLMQSLLNDVVVRGTGAGAANRAGYQYRAKTGGKSGTSANWTDAWFAGFTDKTTSIIWIGLDSSAKSLGRGRSSALVAAPAWFKYMNQVGKIDPPGALPYTINKSGLHTAYVSPYTGLLTTVDDPMGYSELFLAGTTPQTYGNPNAIALIQAQLSQKTEYTVVGESVNLAEQLVEAPVISNDPYIIDDSLSEDLDLSFDLSSGL